MEQRLFRPPGARCSLSQSHFTLQCSSVSSSCADTCLCLNFLLVLDAHRLYSGLLFSWHHNWKAHSSLIVWVQLPWAAVEFLQGLWAGWGTLCFTNCCLGIFLGSVCVTWWWGLDDRTGGCQHIEERSWSGDWRTGEAVSGRNAGACSWHRFSKSTRHLCGAFHCRSD